jgi:membrane protease YdiL (CAAX protease family)
MIVNTQCHATTTSKLNARMKSTYLSRPRTAVPVAIVGTLLIGNFLSNRVMPAALYVPTNLVTAAVVLYLALRVVSPRDMGMTRWASGARWGLAVIAVGLAIFLVGVVLPLTEGLFHDRRVGGGVARLFYELFLRIPLGTVLLEEVAFRGALPAVFAKYGSTFRAVVIASALFGLWHVLPSLNLADVNPVFEGLLGTGLAGQLGGLAIAVGGTFLAGMWLCFLRYRSGSILAPMIVHVASNGGGYALAFLFGGGLITADFGPR